MPGSLIASHSMGSVHRFQQVNSSRTNVFNNAEGQHHTGNPYEQMPCYQQHAHLRSNDKIMLFWQEVKPTSRRLATCLIRKFPGRCLQGRSEWRKSNRSRQLLLLLPEAGLHPYICMSFDSIAMPEYGLQVDQLHCPWKVCLERCNDYNRLLHG